MAAQSLDRKIRQKMKKKILLLAATLLLSLSVAETATAQSAVQRKSYVTSSMARKIANHCKYNGRMEALFATSNNIIFVADARQILLTLDEHLDYAEKFLNALYESYGMRLGRIGLSDMGFTSQETERVAAIWMKEESRKIAVAQQQKKEEEQALMEQIKANDIFYPEELSTEPQIMIDAYNMATYDAYYDNDEKIDYTYHCIMSKDGKLSLENPTDTINYSAMQKFIYEYITSPNLGALDYGYKAGTVMIGGTSYPVNSYVTIHFKEERYKRNNGKGYLNVTIKKNKKTGNWDILTDKSDDIVCAKCKDPEVLKMDLENAIYDCPDLKKLNGKILLKVVIYERRLSSNISQEIELSHYFDLSYTKDTLLEYLKSCFDGEEYIPLKYKVSF